MIKIFIIEKNSSISEEVYDFLVSLCSEYKKTQIIKKKKRDDRENSLIGNALAKYAIKSVFGIPAVNQKFGYTDNQKPYLENYDNIHFSISHSGLLVVCSVSDMPVGIDVIKKRTVSEKIAELIGADKNAEVLNIWTKKEAVIKKEGSGIFKKSLKKIDISKTKTFLYKDYYISVSGEF